MRKLRFSVMAVALAAAFMLYHAAQFNMLYHA
jgi:hypothetical protein